MNNATQIADKIANELVHVSEMMNAVATADITNLTRQPVSKRETSPVRKLQILKEMQQEVYARNKAAVEKVLTSRTSFGDDFPDMVQDRFKDIDRSRRAERMFHAKRKRERAELIAAAKLAREER
ncbi:hypothetical protein FHV99_004649 [Ochrobactrum sp. P20RRXII]|nr:hypothetical protein [Ochrobactrum sp. P20RRXII]NIH77397.1 hypothetical protein [Ochrobactrum sp. P20RRXII]